MRGRLVIEEEFGVFYGKTTDGKTANSTTIEGLLGKLDPYAPEEKLAAAAEILEGIVPSSTGRKSQIHHGIVGT